MKSKTFSLHAFISLFLLQFLFLHAFSSAPNNRRKPSPLEFFKQFQGFQKGDKVKGIQELKKYLQKLGYINPSKTLHNSYNQTYFDDYFDKHLESAIKTYQIFFHLNPTGTIDLKTVSAMAEPRCGVPDIINGTTRMRISSNVNFHSHFRLFNGNPKWALTKENLTYSFGAGFRTEAIDPVRKAFQTWNAVTPFGFTFIDDFTAADIRISFERGDHGDGNPFDGPGGVLAHAFSPTDGRLHFDSDNNWTVEENPNASDIESVALHELGHVFGLAHTEVEEAVMWPSLSLGTTKRVLTQDDILGIQTLYTS